jgi:putative hydrolase
MLPKFDFHVHSSYSSDGEGTAASIVEAAEARGLAAIAVTDHGPELSVGISPDKIIPMLQDIELARKDAGIPVFTGMEANIVGADGEIDLDGWVLEKLDIVVVGLHKLGSFGYQPGELAREYLSAVMNVVKRQRVDILAHPFHFHRYLAPYLSLDEMVEFVKLAAEREVAVEVNSKYRVPDENFLRECLREGVKLSIGTDAHTIAEVGKIDWPMAMLRRVGARQEDLVLSKFLR